MSKCLFIGAYRDGTGWANASLGYILALDSVGVQVVPRAIKLNNDNSPIPSRIEELEKESIEGCDVCIQHVLPNMMEYNAGFRKNIGMFASETSNFSHANWATNLNMMDEIVVFCNQQVDAAINSGVKKPLHLVPHAFDIDKYQQSYDPIPLPCSQDDYIFYYVGEFSKRKNVMAIIQAFHLTFHRHEPVQLLLKVNIPGKSPDETMKFIGDFCNNIKAGMKIYNNYGLYKKEMILTDHLSDKDMMRLHNTGHCFVLASRGEACCIPAVEAAAFDRSVICTDNIGTNDYLQPLVNEEIPIGNSKCIFVQSYAESCFGEENQIPYLYTGEEEWQNISVKNLSECMREMFECRNITKEDEGINADFVAENFNYYKIGNMLKEIIDG